MRPNEGFLQILLCEQQLLGEFEQERSIKPECRPKGRHSWALWLPMLLEEGCHSAEFHTTIHDGHHLLLSIGWQFDGIPRAYWKYDIP